jgi:alkylation response protein AidB-like acyl-CoA dehydrogenase
MPAAPPLDDASPDQPTDSLLTAALPEQALFAVSALAETLATTAVERDRCGGHAAAERGLIRRSGLLDLLIPTALGGRGQAWPLVYRVVRQLARVDSALAHVLAFHHLQLATVQLYGTAEQQARLQRQTIEQGWFWGNALNPLDHRLLALPEPGGWRLTGAKSFASGSVGSDRMVLSAWHEESASLLIGEIDSRAPGVHIDNDWDAFGQRQTDSGTVRFENVFLHASQVLLAPGQVPPTFTTLRSQLAQLILANLYTGIAQGALAEAVRFCQTQSRPWMASGVTRAVDDPHVQRRFGELRVLVRPAELLSDLAAAQLHQALSRGAALTTDERGAVAMAVSEAKVVAHRAAIEVSSQIFELTGARSTAAVHGLDRFWRNARVHTLHDPVDYKLRDLGRQSLTGAWPEPSPYS